MTYTKGLVFPSKPLEKCYKSLKEYHINIEIYPFYEEYVKKFPLRPSNVYTERCFLWPKWSRCVISITLTMSSKKIK
jgi:hypothetical protein